MSVAAEELTGSARLALDTILQQPVQGIPTWRWYPMEHRIIDRIAGAPEGSYRRHPEETYLAFLRNSGICTLDQYIPLNPLRMGTTGFEGTTHRRATEGVEEVVLDGIRIDSPEAVVEHLERVVWPRLRAGIATFDEEARVRQLLQQEAEIQAKLGPGILKTGYGMVRYPALRYGAYGYTNYLLAYGLYPEVMERDFALQADAAIPNNRAVARAHAEGRLPPLYRLAHDMAHSRGTLVSIESLDRLWFPHFARALAPLLNTDVKLIWHCDGNLMEMVPRLLEVGLKGFQGFQYEHGMDYERLCRMKAKDGSDLIIIAGVTVSRTLPFGTPADVRAELRWLVEHGPRTGLMLSCSSAATPGVPWENIQTLMEGFTYYREHGRS